MKYTSQTPVKRMKKRSEFTSMPRGNAIHSRGFVFSYALNESGEVKIGFTASKKVGNAVCRARAKRRMRAVVDDVIRLNPDFSCKGASFVLIARKYILSCDYDKMKRDLQQALQEIGLES